MNIQTLKSRIIHASLGRICLSLLVVYTFLCGEDLNYAVSVKMSVFEYVLYVLTDHYYMVYAWLFFLVFFSAHQVKEKRLIERLRFHTLKEFYRLERFVKIIQIFSIIGLHVLLPLIIGLSKLQFHNAFRAAMPGDIFDSNLEVLTAYSEYFKTPISAIVCVILYWVIGSVFISEFIYYCSEIWQKKGMLISILFVIISTMAGFMTQINDPIKEVFFLNHYYILHHVLLNIGVVPMVVNLFVMFLGIILFEKIAISKNCNKKIGAKETVRILFTVRPAICLLFFGSLVLLGITAAGADAAAWGLVKGFSYKEFQLTEFLYYIAPEVFVLFFVNMTWENESNSRNELVMFRVGSRIKWNKIMERSCLKFLTKSWVTYLGMIGIVLWCCKFVFCTQERKWLWEVTEYYGLSEGNIWNCMLIALFVRILELYFLYSIDRFVFVLTANAIASYLVTFVLYVPGMIYRGIDISLFGKGCAYQILELFAEKQEMLILVIIAIHIGFIAILSWLCRNKKLITRKEIVCQRL
ncbi:MAG: hypothetical protein ACI4HI_17735 [Lachnospiraceae bacterium]